MHTLLFAASATSAEPTGDPLTREIVRLEQSLPRDSKGFAALDAAQWRVVSREIDLLAAAASRQIEREQPPRVLLVVGQIVTAKQRVDRLLDQTLELRRTMGAENAERRNVEALRNYLRAASELIDLSGRLNATLDDAVDQAAFKFAGQPIEREKLIDLLAREKSGTGASVMSLALLDPLPDTPNGARPASPATKAKLLAMIAASGQLDILPVVAEFLLSGEATPELTILVAEAVRGLGLPQDPRPGEEKQQPPVISALELRTALVKLPPASLTGVYQRRRQDLLAWLDARIARGVTEDGYRLGGFEVQPGDWLLMRNPSPYNLFTDLSPGLFTHVGVAAMETGADGKRRMVLVDLPERGTRMPATNVETYVQRTLHYCFLRHEDPAIARKMGQVAASLIGTETEFDLTFRTERIAQLKHQLAAGTKIKTYCAGLLLLCAQETDLERQEFFPIAEFPALGKTVENLRTLGLDFGRDLISPTGPLFARRMRMVGRREPLYNPSHEIEETIYDHFSTSLVTKTLAPTPDLFQSLRLKVAEASKSNPVLAQALAAAAGVNADTDLVSAAKAAAVVETLDEIAYGHSRQFRDAYLSLTSGTPKEMAAEGLDAKQIARLLEYREHHAQLWQQRQSGQLAVLECRRALITYYVAHGLAELNKRFFSP